MFIKIKINYLTRLLIAMACMMLLNCKRPPKNSTPISGFTFQNGDLIFQDLDCGELCDAIEKVTHGINNKPFSHIGLVLLQDDSVFVIEAVNKDVHLTSVAAFINRSKDESGRPKIIIGRLKKSFQSLKTAAVKYAVKQIGVEYDNEFIYNNGKYYCSELIYDAYKYANKNEAFFDMQPMTFKDPLTRQLLPAWKDYYKNLSMEIPEGKPGCNPAGISKSDKLEMLDYK